MAGSDVVAEPGAARHSDRDRPGAGWPRTPLLPMYRFAIEEVYRQQEHVLDEKGERLMSLSSRLSSAPNEAYQALSTADAKFPEVALSTGEKITVSYGQYRAVLATNRRQADRRAAFLAITGRSRRTQHLRVALPQRLPARLVPRARARLWIDARRRAARQQHSAVGRRDADRGHARRRGAAPPLPPAAAQVLKLDQYYPLRLFDPAHRVESSLRLRSRSSSASLRPSRRSAPSTRSGCVAASASAGSTSTKTKASAAALTPRRSMACIRTCS